jgi:hypothetical protein
MKLNKKLGFSLTQILPYVNTQKTTIQIFRCNKNLISYVKLLYRLLASQLLHEEVKKLSRASHADSKGERSSYPFLTSALDGGWVVSVTRQPRFTPGTHWKGSWVSPRACLYTEVMEKILCLCRGMNPGRLVFSQTLYWATGELTVCQATKRRLTEIVSCIVND